MQRTAAAATPTASTAGPPTAAPPTAAVAHAFIWVRWDGGRHELLLGAKCGGKAKTPKRRRRAIKAPAVAAAAGFVFAAGTSTFLSRVGCSTSRWLLMLQLLLRLLLVL